MAEAIVVFVAEKLGDLIVKEAQLLGGLRNQVKSVQGELENIRCYLRDADSKRRKGDARAERWLNELRSVAYRIEDATDTFYLELDDHKSGFVVEDDAAADNSSMQKIIGALFRKPKKLGHEIKKLPSLHKFGTELEEIQKELEEIFKSKERFGIQPLQDDCCEPVDDIVLSKRRAAYDDVDEAEVVRLHSNKDGMLQLLRSREETPIRRAVITIVGQGGLGKTTLARMVYNSAKVDFEYHIMLSVSQQFNLTDLLKKMIKKMTNSVLENQDVDYYVAELKNILSGKRYLIILDDVWVVNLWDQLKPALPDDKNGSRVLITSRKEEVGKSADPEMKLYKLALLNDEESLNLLLKKALPNYHQEPNKECPSDSPLKLADQLSKKCKGLPLALIVLGGILSMRDQTYHDWYNVLNTMDWSDEGKDCLNILALSYDDMPYYLKPCFLYLASFPEDSEISAEHLISMWVAEGFIPQRQREKKTLEEIAEVFLKELLQRNMVQVTSRSVNGSIKNCQVHDLLRELAIEEAAKENFVMVQAGEGEAIVGHNVNKNSRRVSLQSVEFLKYVDILGPNTRSLLCSYLKSEIFDLAKYCVQLRLLRVLQIVNVKRVYAKGLDKLIHLKYLEFRLCDIVEFPADFSWGSLKNLEALYCSSINLRKPEMKSLWTIGTLRHVGLPDNIDGPPAHAKLRNLQTLGRRIIPATWGNENQVPLLNNLRKLSLYINNNKNLDGVVHLLGTLPYLLSLRIGFSNLLQIPKEIVYPRGLLNYENLQSLYLQGKWSKDIRTLEASLFPPRLLELGLWDSALGQDPMLELGKLNSLKDLKLHHNVYEGGVEMTCPSGFPVLETLWLHLGNIKSITVMEGVMPKLKDLYKVGMTQLNMPHLKHLS